MTYTSLLASLRRYIERGNAADTEVFDELPNLVQLAEYDIATKLKILGFLTNVTNSMTATDPVIAKPDRWRETASFNYQIGSTRTPLFPRSYEYCRAYWPDPTVNNVANPPRFYADYDYDNWLVVPTPALAYDFEVNYWELPELLSVGNQTNWLTDHAPNALMFGALVQAEPFLKNDSRLNTWGPLDQGFLAALDGEDLQRILDRSTVRTEV